MNSLSPEFVFNVDEFIFGDFIGSGTSGNVYLIQHKNTGDLYAAKVSNFKINSRNFRFDEVVILSKNNYPALLSLKGYSPVNFKKENFPVLFFEYYPNGSLNDYLKGNEKDDTSRYIFILGIAIGLRHLHLHHRIHRDIKPANIIIDNNFNPVISDFGT